MGMFFKSPRIQLRCEVVGLCEKWGLPRERVRAELMGMRFKSTKIHLACVVLMPCEKDGACIWRGSELNSWGWISNTLGSIYDVKCGGLVKRMGLA